ncbi:DUF2490 domain-containing protein [Rhodoflexus sp.]
MSKFSLIFLLVLSHTGFDLAFVYGQERTNWWTRFSVSKPINTVFHTELEAQLRLQNNPFDYSQRYLANEHLMHSIRLFAYWKPSELFSVGISPLAWFTSSPIICTPADADMPRRHEFRPSALAEWQPILADQLTLAIRSWIEYRHFTGLYNDMMRFRQRIGLRYRLDSKWQFVLAEELFINTSGAEQNQRYDHNRLIFNLNYKPMPGWRIELGYVYINRLMRKQMRHIDENNIITHFYYTLPSGKTKSHKN